MSKLLFYRQARRDGGVRMGVELDGELLLHRFEEGTAESDPSLLWFVDVACLGVRLGFDSEALRDWLLANKEAISEAIVAFASDLEVGIDANAWPVRKEFPRAIPRVKLTISCSAVRRVDAREIATHLRQLARNWSRYITGLAAMQKSLVLSVHPHGR